MIDAIRHGTDIPREDRGLPQGLLVKGQRRSTFTMSDTRVAEMKEEVVIDGELNAIILKAEYDEDGIQFFTSHDLPQQLGSMSYSPGKIIPAHAHKPIQHEVHHTMETLFIRRGKVRVDFYSNTQAYRCSRILQTGDVILLLAGGHGFEVLEQLNMVEVKQGPYEGDHQKIAITSAPPSKLTFK